MPAIRLIVGLGNPGAEYRDTRHNVGFMILDRLAAAADVAFRVEKGWKTEVAKIGDRILCKPLTFMNSSGEAVRAIIDFYKLSAAETLIVLDDIALPTGKLRLRRRGSSGGHNGLQSVLDHLGTSDLPRLRIGIGQAEPGGAIGHVLGRFKPDEKNEFEETLQRAEAAIEAIHAHGMQFAMNACN
jgi:PTH1 family peptidyl-tRNA hydrolase